MDEIIYLPNKTDAQINDIIKAHSNCVYHVLALKKQTGNQEAESAAWEALWKAVQTFDVYGNTQFTTYAYKLITNAVYDVLRKQARMYDLIQFEADIEFNGRIAKPTDEVIFIETAFKTYVSKVGSMQQNVLYTWYGSSFEMSCKRIAKHCKCSISYVHRTQNAFRAYLLHKLKR